MALSTSALLLVFKSTSHRMERREYLECVEDETTTDLAIGMISTFAFAIQRWNGRKIPMSHAVGLTHKRPASHCI